LGHISQTSKPATWAIALLLASCGSGGGDSAAPASPGATNAASIGTVHLVDHEPANGAVQVDPAAVIVLRFDARMAIESFGDADTWLRAAGAAAPVAGTFELSSHNRVYFRPQAPLQLETDYTFQLSALTCDEDGRILDQEVRFAFRTLDTTPPTLIGIDVAAGAIGVARDRAFRLQFHERLAPASVMATTLFVSDAFGVRYKANLACDGDAVVLDPTAELPGDRQFLLVATTGLRDLAGNALASASSTPFHTAPDVDAPAVVDTWPAPGQLAVSPRAQPHIFFDESMDPTTVDSTSLGFIDEFGAIVPFTVAASDDQRTLYLVPSAPLVADRGYTLAFALGESAATDVSGNALAATQPHSFRTGVDDVAPAVTASEPADGSDRVPSDVVTTVTFDEALDPAWLDERTVELLVAGEAWETLVEATTPVSVRVTPLVPLPLRASCQLRFRGGHEGVRDLHGNLLAADLEIGFTTSDDAGTPTAMILPPNGAIHVAVNAQVAIAFDAPMDPNTLHAGTLAVTDDDGVAVPGSWQAAASARGVRFTPSQPFPAGAWRRVVVRAGQDGVRRASGNWLRADTTSRFRIGASVDLAAPTVTCTVNGVAAARKQGLTLPPSGFTIDFDANDAAGGHIDVASAQILLDGPGTPPDAAALLREGVLGRDFARLVAPSSTRLAGGDWTLRVRVSDLAGNFGESAALAFHVAEPAAAIVPFERTQVVWVRAELDRDGNGVADFDDDMTRLGLAVAGGNATAIAFVRTTLLNAVLTQTSRLYGRGDRGEPRGSDSAAVRLTTREPIKVPHMQIALGGFDPDGPRHRGFGAASTGVLGRALFDLRNGNPAERNTTSSPGLGVFPAEMFVYQSQLHLQVWPSYMTRFAERFLPLCPAMGGTPVGAHPHDAAALRAGFDPVAATSAQRARRQTVLAAVDDWAAVVGIVLAHEIGHSVGLVAPGDAPTGLYGDASLHNTFAGATEVMSSTIGYESMTTLSYAFRDLDMAYLRHRTLLR